MRLDDGFRFFRVFRVSGPKPREPTKRGRKGRRGFRTLVHPKEPEAEASGFRV